MARCLVALGRAGGGLRRDAGGGGSERAVNLEAHVLRFEGETATEVATPAYKGSMIRGALLAALRRDFCLDREGPRCATAGVRQACPVCSLLVTADEESARGVEVARPCTVEPPLEERRLYGRGDRFSFGVSLFGDAAELLPYVIIGARRMGETGMGDRRRAPGRFLVRRIEAVDPIAGARQELYREGEGLVRRSEMVVTHERILERAGRCDAMAVTLELLTPMRLVSGGGLGRTATSTCCWSCLTTHRRVARAAGWPMKRSGEPGRRPTCWCGRVARSMPGCTWSRRCRRRWRARGGCCMQHDPARVAETREWLAKAALDLRAAAFEFTARARGAADGG